jgi:hypothetical protein
VKGEARGVQLLRTSNFPRDEISHGSQRSFPTCFLEAGRRIQSASLSFGEVTQAALARIAELDRQLSSYATPTADLALVQATQADAEIARGVIWGPLHGARTNDIPKAAGMTIQKNYRTEGYAAVVAQPREAGVVLPGKLQLTAGALAQHHPSINPPVNPWSVARRPGIVDWPDAHSADRHSINGGMPLRRNLWAADLQGDRT